MPGRLQNYWNRRKSSFSSSGRPKRTPLPKNVVIACLCGLFPSAFLITMLFPFLPWMVKQFTVNGEKITELNSGPYVGLIASSLFFGRFAGSYFWGWFSDVKGRRPAMLYSVALLAVATTMFGFTNSALGLGWAVFTRFLTGLFNGIVGTSKAVLSEVCDNSNQAQALTLLTASFNLGLIVGPAVGGFLAEPARQYPSTFGGSSFLKLFPYVLPSMVSLALCIFGFVVMFKFLPETLASKRKYKKVGGGADSGEISSIGNGDVNSRNGRPESRGSWMVAFSAASKKTSIHSGPDILNNADDVSLDDSLSIHINHGATERYDEDDEELVEENCDPFVNASSFAAPLLSNGVSSSNNNAVPSLLQNGVKETVTAVHGPAGSDAEILSQSNNGEGDSDADDDIDDSLVMPPPGYSSCACWRWLLRYRLVRLLDRSKFMKILRRPTTRYVILLYSFYSVGVIGMDEIFSLWCSEPPHLGGLGLELNTIGTVLAIVGVAQLPLQTFVVPIFERRLGARKCFGVMSIPLIISTAIMPSLTSMASSSAVIPTLVIVQLVHKFSNGGSFVCLMLMINNSVETHDLGAANGLAMSMTGCFRSLAPLACGSIFAWSIDGEHVFPFDYHLVFFLLSFLFLCTSIASTRVSDLVDKKLGTHADDVDVRQEENNAPGVAVAADAEQANQIEDVLEEAV
ncbi:uncharacterized protein LOC135808864 [Sycon ciliatum]|uniref:uncharacterized protein LOC135808864 n=1 Tax=Sycon ciliatum TaxID=27933 RepID=UPI0031F5FA08